MASTVTIDGLSQLDEALQWLSKTRARGVLRKAALAGGQPIEDAWQTLAPRSVGDGHHMADTGGEGTRLSPRQSKLARKEGKAFVEVYVGPGPDPAAVQEEFGNAHQPPHPFMRPAWESTKDQALKIITDTLEAEIGKVKDTAAARLAKNAARDARRYGG